MPLGFWSEEIAIPLDFSSGEAASPLVFSSEAVLPLGFPSGEVTYLDFTLSVGAVGEFISWKYSGMNLTRHSSRPSACRKWQACDADADVERKTSPLTSPTEETVSLTEISVVHHRKKALNLPYSDEVHSQAFPRKRILEFSCDLFGLRLSRTN